MRGRLLLLLIVAIIVPVVGNYYVQGLASSAASSNLSVSVSASRIYGLNLQKDQTVLVNLTISGVSNLAAVRLHLAWDPNVLEVTTGDSNGWTDPWTYISYGIQEGPFLKTFTNQTRFLVNAVDNVAGNISAIYDAIIPSGVSASGSGVFATVNFTCVSPGITAIRIVGGYGNTSGVQDTNGVQIPHTNVDGLITNEPAPPPPASPPVWTALWFQVSVGFALIEIGIIALIILVIARWWRSQAAAEGGEVEDFLS